jgi:hypothetical protein
MNTWQRAALAAAFLIPMSAMGQETSNDDEQSNDEQMADEIVVLGRSITTT